MDNNVWNYDLEQCPVNTVCQFKRSYDGVPIIGILKELARGISEQVAIVQSDKSSEFREVCVAWAPFTPPSEPEVWIPHDNNSFPKCHPLDVIKIRLQGASAPISETFRAQERSWVNKNVKYGIAEYCIVEKYVKNDSGSE